MACRNWFPSIAWWRPSVNNGRVGSKLPRQLKTTNRWQGAGVLIFKEIRRERYKSGNPLLASEPTQEVIVRIRFHLDEQNRIELEGVSGSSRSAVQFVREQLQGVAMDGLIAQPGAAFSSTLRLTM